MWVAIEFVPFSFWPMENIQNGLHLPSDWPMAIFTLVQFGRGHIVTVMLYIYQDTLITVSICLGSTQGPQSVCTVPIVTYIFHCCIYLYGVCTVSAQCPHCAHCYIYIQSLYPFVWGPHRVCTGSTQYPHCVCNADGIALPQFELCVTLTALPSLFKDNCRPNMDLRDWLVDLCQSKQVTGWVSAIIYVQMFNYYTI